VKGAAMEITIRHVLEVSPQLAELLGRLLGVAQDGRQGASEIAPTASMREPGPALEAALPGTLPQAPHPGPEAPAADAARLVPGAWRTEARRDVLRDLYPRGVKLSEMYAELAAIPGPPIPPERYHVTHWARDMKLRRPGDGAEKWRTPERQVILQETWPAGVDVAEIVTRMQALPGGPVLAARVSVWAAQLKLARPEEHKAKLARERMARIRDTRWVKAPAAPAQDGAAVAAAAGPVSDPPARPVAVVPEPARVAAPAAAKPPPLPDAVDGLVRASFREIRAWAAYFGIRYDGANVDVVNRRRVGLGLTPVAQCEVRTMADSARAA
jgi:hypothetical protein